MNRRGSIATCLQKYATFGGRAQRSELWSFFLFVILSYGALWIIGIMIVIGVILADGAVSNIIGVILADGTSSSIAITAILVFLLPSLAVSVRRLHDTGRSAWWLLLLLLPVLGTIALLAFFVLPGTVGPNRYGESPHDPKSPGFAPVDPGKAPSPLRWLLLRYQTRPLSTLVVSTLCVMVFVFGCNWLWVTSTAPARPNVVGHKVHIEWGRDTAEVSWTAVEGATHYKIYQSGFPPYLDGEVKAPGTRYRDGSPNTNAADLGLSFATTSYRVKACNGFACSRYSNQVTVD